MNVRPRRLRTVTESRLETDDVGDRWLTRAALFFAIAVIVHNADHLRRGGENLNRDVFWVGGLGGVLLEVGVVVLICQHHRLAPLAAAAAGAFLAVAYIEVHFLPAHRFMSDPFPGAPHISLVSWMAASLEVVAAVVIAILGFVVLRRRGGLTSAVRPYASERRIVEAITDLLALVLIFTQAMALVVFFVQRYG